MYKLKNVNGRVNALLRTGKDFVKNNLSVSAAQHIIDNQWYFEGVKVKKTVKKVPLSSVYEEDK